MSMKKKCKFLLDTNVLIEFTRENPTVVGHVLGVGADKCCLSVISLHELYFGAQLARERKEEYYEKELRRIARLLRDFKVLALEAKGEEYGEVKYALRASGQMIEEFDMMIAGQAISEGLTVVTDNLKHFGRIEGLHVENWVEQ